MGRRSINSERELQAEEDFLGITPFDRMPENVEPFLSPADAELQAEEDFLGITPFDRV